MLRFLSVSHLAVIDRLEVEFEPGFNVLTGETGAGKSMLVEALGLLMGGRAAPDLIRTGESQATVQAVFEAPDGRELILRREITVQGRSRAFLNDALVTAAALKEHAAGLVELHGQHEHQTLLDPQSHLDLLDSAGGLNGLRQEVAEAYRVWTGLRHELENLHMDEREKAARLDLLRFQVNELERAAPRSGEDVELAAARHLLANAEKLQQLCSEAYAALYESDEAALARLGLVWRRVADLAQLDPSFVPYLESRDLIKSQLEDLAYALRARGGEIDNSPARLQEVEDRLALLERLKRKYGPTLADAITARDALRQQLETLEHVEGRKADLDAACAAARRDYLRRAQRLAQQRRTAATSFSRSIQQLLGELAMGSAKFEMRFDPGEVAESGWTDRGLDRAEWYLSTNVGEDVRPLARVASGGELSRVMLAVRNLAAADAPGRTLVFDEIDAGIGGRVAEVVGGTLRRLGDAFQVLCITHFPQIAAQGATHYHISKAVSAGRTVTSVVRLTQTERVEEIARMIGGAEPTAATRAAAEELLSGREEKAKGESEGAKAKGRRAAPPR